jgi:hypothetical protein
MEGAHLSGDAPPLSSAFYSSASYAATVTFVRLESGLGLICFPSDWIATVAGLTSVTSGFWYLIVLYLLP